MILGLSKRVADASLAPPLEARLHVGDAVELRLEQAPPPGSTESCGFTNAEVWTSTNPAVATVVRDSYTWIARVRVNSLGAFTVFVDFTAADGGRHRTTLAYCEADVRSSLPGNGVLCSDARKIGVVTVVP